MSIKPAYLLCPLCNRFPHGFGYSDPKSRMWMRAGQQSMRVFCSRYHQHIYHAVKRHYGEDSMIDPAPHEIAAMRAAIKPLTEFVESEMGFETPLMEYDRDEILALIEVIVTAYHDALLLAAEKQWPEIDIPFDPKKSLKAGG
jgi:Family of unknown function (DUF6511)